MTNKDYAILYLKKGFSVIPTNGKRPLIEWLKYSKEKPTEQQVNNWWSTWPSADIAIATGSVSNIVVVDIDGGEIPTLPDTVISETSPGHFQYFFKYPGFLIQNSVKIVANNIDIRGDGGFVVVPPSRHFNKETGIQDFKYRWLKDPENNTIADLPLWITEKTKDKKRIEEIVLGTTQGARNSDTAVLIGSMLPKYHKSQWETICWPLIEAWNNNNKPPLSLNELRSVFNSISSRQNLSQNDTPYTVGTDMSKVNEANTSSLIKFIPLPLAQLSSTQNSIEWIWEGFVAKKHITLLSALFKAGKTTLIANFLKTLQDNGRLAGQNTNKASVLILSEESDTIWARRRDEHNITLPVWISSRPIRQKLGYKEWVNLLEEAAKFCEENKVDILIIDTLSAFWSVENENDAARVSAALLPLNHLLDKNIAILLVHHFRKTGGDEGTAARGSGALGAGVDILVEFSRLDSSDPNCTQRVIKTYSRFDESPKEVVIDYVDDEYVTIGTKADVKRSQKLEAVIKALEDYQEGVTISELHEKWNSDEIGKVPSKRTLYRYLSELVNQSLVLIIDNVKIKGGTSALYKLSASQNLRQEATDESIPITISQGKNPSQDNEQDTLSKVNIEKNEQQIEVENLIKEEKDLRRQLRENDKHSQAYAEIYSKWFALRDKGVEMGVFQYFVPSPNE